MSIDITIEEMEALPAEFDGKLSRCTDGESAGR